MPLLTPRLERDLKKDQDDMKASIKDTKDASWRFSKLNG